MPPISLAFLSQISLLFSCSVVSDSLQSHGLPHTRSPCPSPTPEVYSNWRPLSRSCHPTISSSVVPFFSRLQSFPASRSFPVSQLFTSGSQSTGESAPASVLPVNVRAWSPLGRTGWVSCWHFSPRISPSSLVMISYLFYNEHIQRIEHYHSSEGNMVRGVHSLNPRGSRLPACSLGLGSNHWGSSS